MSLLAGWKGTAQIYRVAPPHCLPQVVARGLAQVVVFEDDVRFESNFQGRLRQLMAEVEAERLPWDLM